MKAAVMTGKGRMGLVDVPDPGELGADEVLLKVGLVGVCGSDMHYFRNGRIGSCVVEYPFCLGHEFCGTVAGVGGSVEGICEGDLAAVDPAIGCGECDQCVCGRENTCRNLRFLGCPGELAGCLCEYVVMPARCVFVVSGRLSAEQAVLVEPFSIGLYAVKQAGVKSGDSAAIFGSGPIGLCVLSAAKRLGAGEVFVTEKLSWRMDAALGAGAKWVGSPEEQDMVEEILKRCNDGVDIAFECAGKQETIDEAVKVLKPGGKLLLIGIPEEMRISFNVAAVRRKELTIINVRRQNGSVEEAIDMIAAGQVDLDFMVTHRFGLSECQDAFDMVADYRDGVIKAMIEV